MSRASEGCGTNQRTKHTYVFFEIPKEMTKTKVKDICKLIIVKNISTLLS